MRVKMESQLLRARLVIPSTLLTKPTNHIAISKYKWYTHRKSFRLPHDRNAVPSEDLDYGPRREHSFGRLQVIPIKADNEGPLLHAVEGIVMVDVPWIGEPVRELTRTSCPHLSLSLPRRFA